MDGQRGARVGQFSAREGIFSPRGRVGVRVGVSRLVCHACTHAPRGACYVGGRGTCGC